MPRANVEPLRRAALVEATIAEVAEAGQGTTVAAIARRAGVSSALAHHYFGSKDRILIAAMRHVLSVFGAEVRGALAMADTPRRRVEAVVRASFTAGNFRDAVVAAWLNFYVQAQRDPEARRLLHLYHRRLRSNLLHGLRGTVAAPEEAAEALAALIDGLYVRQALRAERLAPEACAALVLAQLDRMEAA